MNIASFLMPKSEVAYLYDNMTLRQGAEKLRRSGFSAIPVIDVEDRYVGVISVADILWNVLAFNQSLQDITLKNMEQMTVREFIQNGKVKPACIDTAMEHLLERAKSQNFVPVVDDRNVFIGIVTRSDIIKYFMDKCRECGGPDFSRKM